MEQNNINWNEVVDFFSKKYLLTKASFTNSFIELNGNTIDVTLGAKGKFMLLQKNIDKTVSDYIFNTTGSRYIINFIEPDINIVQNQNNIQDSIAKTILEENAKRAKEIEEEKLNKKSKTTKKEKSQDGVAEDNNKQTNYLDTSNEDLNSLLGMAESELKLEKDAKVFPMNIDINLSNTSNTYEKLNNSQNTYQNNDNQTFKKNANGYNGEFLRRTVI